ncbi:MAG: hypothetical protein GX350_03180 [Erysipelotrichaceae bacterium]|nr:hypothetical protein [Erysipelotrichaceae bacterium]
MAKGKKKKKKNNVIDANVKQKGASKKKRKERPQKIKTAKEQPKPRVWATIFKSLFSNVNAIAGGRFLAWWIALVLFVVSIGLSITPILVQVSNVQGSDIFNHTQYGYQTGLLAFSEELEDNLIDLEVSEKTSIDGTTSYYMINNSNNWNDKFDDKVTLTLNSTSTDYDFHYFSYKNHSDVEQLRVFYVPNHTIALGEEISDENATIDYVQLIDYLTSFSYDNSREENFGEAPISFLVLGSKTYHGAIYRPLSSFKVGDKIVIDGQRPEASVSGTYSEGLVGTKLHEFVKYLPDYKNKDNAPTVLDGSSPNTREQYVQGVFENWKHFLNEGYRPVKRSLFWVQFAVAAGTNASIILLMGLVIFLITRGKTSPNRDWTFLQSMKISAWSALSPGLLALILGFIMPSFSGMAFIMLFGMRLMWMSMKQLRPAVQPPSK